MIYPSADKLENLGSKYALVVLAAKRAKQIKSGVQPLINTDSRNPLTIALEEIAAGKITCEVPDTDIIVPVSPETEVAQLLAIPEHDEEEELEAGVAEEETTLTLDDELAEEKSEKFEEEEEEEEEPELLGLDVEEDEDEEPVVAPDTEEDLTFEEKPKRKRKSKEEVELNDIDIDAIEEIETDEEPSED